jgi:general secretion pathway protein D
MVRSLAKTRDLYVDEKLNLLVVRDTPEAVRMIERLIAAQDLADAEVMLEVEVLEVAHTLLQQIGPSAWSAPPACRASSPAARRATSTPTWCA